MKTLKVKTNKNNVQYALTQIGDLYAVYKLCENYCRNAKGGISKTWRYVEKGLTLDNAEILFNRRTK